MQGWVEAGVAGFGIGSNIYKQGASAAAVAKVSQGIHYCLESVEIMKVALVTGAGSGIGKASAIALAKAGYTVVLAGPPPRCLGSSRQGNRQGRTSRGNGRGRSQIRGQSLCQDQGEVRPAGCGFQQRRNRGTRHDQSRGSDVSSIGRRRRCQSDGGLPLHPRRLPDHEGPVPKGGRIINNGSISAHVPRPNSAAYAATKHAITGLTRSLSLDGPRIRHRLRPDRHRQCRDGAATKTWRRARLQANGTVEPEAAHGRERCRRGVVYMAESAARGERSVHDRDGDKDALYRPWLRPHR